MILRNFGVRAAVVVLAVLLAAGVVAVAPADAARANHFHCSAWHKIEKGFPVRVRSCIKLVHDGGFAKVLGRFEARNNGAKKRKLSWFPQVKSRHDGNTSYSGMNAAGNKKVPAHQTVTLTAHAEIGPPGNKMWLWVQWRLLHIGKRNILFQNTPKVHPYWT
jgi:hypothetical protein